MERKHRREWRLAHSRAAVMVSIGATTCFVGEQMFFGQDRLDFLREALACFKS